jgi:hypothetical protein
MSVVPKLNKLVLFKSTLARSWFCYVDMIQNPNITSCFCGQIISTKEKQLSATSMGMLKTENEMQWKVD